MPALNKQTLVNLLIDSPLREPIKINLIDIVNNTNDADLPKVYPTITKELEIFQKATDRRLKLADETIKKLSSEGADTPAPATTETTESTEPTETTTPPTPLSEAKIANEAADEVGQAPTVSPDSTALQVPPLDLPPLPAPSKVADDVGPAPKPTEDTTPSSEAKIANEVTDGVEPNIPPVAEPTDLPASPAEQTLPPSPATNPSESEETADEAALKEIQKELDALKDDAAQDANPPAPATTPSAPAAQPEV